MKHLYANTCHEESEVWCGKVGYYVVDGEPARKPEEASCLDCLSQAASFGKRAAMRFNDLYTGLKS